MVNRAQLYVYQSTIQHLRKSPLEKESAHTYTDPKYYYGSSPRAYLECGSEFFGVDELVVVAVEHTERRTHGRRKLLLDLTATINHTEEGEGGGVRTREREETLIEPEVSRKGQIWTGSNVET